MPVRARTKDDGPLHTSNPVRQANRNEWRRFGPSGPVYEIIDTSAVSGQIRIRVLESGEIAELPASQVLTDPPAD